jgi:hypothetical protein
MYFIAKIFIIIAAISLPAFAMDPPKSCDWWGLKIQGSPTIKAQAVNNIVSLKIGDITGLSGEVRAHTVNIQCSSEQEENLAHGKYLKVVANIFTVNGHTHPCALPELGPFLPFSFELNDFSNSNSQANLFYLPLTYINIKEIYITMETVSVLINCIKEQFRRGMEPINIKIKDSTDLIWKFSTPLILKDEGRKFYIYGIKLVTKNDSVSKTIEELKTKFQSFIRSFNKAQTYEDGKYNYSIRKWSNFSSRPPHYEVEGGVIHPIDATTVLSVELYIQPAIADDDF